MKQLVYVTGDRLAVPGLDIVYSANLASVYQPARDVSWAIFSKEKAYWYRVTDSRLYLVKCNHA